MANIKLRRSNKKISIKILFFAYAKEIVNKNYLNLKVNNITNVKEVLEKLYIDYPDLKKINFSVALNNEYINDYEIILKNKDVISIIPPVSGG
ncbi:MAG: MoaD/ThiS family protein [bacterium]|nr:MoaD/ThiS family protein [bacterium]